MGLPTPGAYMGQSLVPILRGQAASPARPIVAEGRLKRAMVLPDGLKVIADQRRGTVEVYDLRRDPAELHDLSGEAGAPAAAQGLLTAFFQAQTLKRWGYTPPYRP
jgi:hypothetical protein